MLLQPLNVLIVLMIHVLLKRFLICVLIFCMFWTTFIFLIQFKVSVLILLVPALKSISYLYSSCLSLYLVSVNTGFLMSKNKHNVLWSVTKKNSAEKIYLKLFRSSYHSTEFFFCSFIILFTRTAYFIDKSLLINP